jgi:hypothetical protein
MSDLFDNFPRSHGGPAGHAESRFSWLNRSGRPEVARVRDILESWFARFPAPEQPDLRSRFRSSDKKHHQGALLELFLHELLLRLGSGVTVHPIPLTATTRRPDFLEGSPTDSAYVEATVVTGQSNAQAAAEARVNQLYEILERMPSPNFFIGIELGSWPSVVPPAGQIRAFLQQRMADLDPDEVMRTVQLKGTDAYPRWLYEFQEWRVEFIAIPKSAEARGGKDIRPLGLFVQPGHYITTMRDFRSSVVDKAGAYGDLALPYVVAANVAGEWPIRNDEVTEALFGDVVYTVSMQPGGPGEPTPHRKPNGVWRGRTGPTYTRLSAVLVVNELYPWALNRAKVRLYHNPWAARSYSGPMNSLPQARVEDDRITLLPGESLAEIFDLPDQWPYE